jgi:hypothetical protein
VLNQICPTLIDIKTGNNKNIERFRIEERGKSYRIAVKGKTAPVTRCGDS